MREEGAAAWATSWVLFAVGIPVPISRNCRTPHPEPESRRDRQHPLCRLPVGGEVVLAAQPVVVDAGGMGHGGIDLGRLLAARENTAEPVACHRAAVPPAPSLCCVLHRS